MKTLNADLKSGEFRPVYLLYGDESFLLRSYKGRFMQKVAGGDGMNTAYFEGKDINEDDVITAGDTMPFFAEHRLVVVENSGWFKGSVEKIADWIQEMPDTTVLLFVEESVDKRNRLYKAVQKKGYICELKHPEHKELSVWAARYLAAAGKKITASTMDRILEYTGDDMENLRNELEKLISYLSEEAKRQNSPRITIPFNRQQLADYLSVDRSAMSSELGRMRDEGLLEFEKNRFRLF